MKHQRDNESILSSMSTGSLVCARPTGTVPLVFSHFAKLLLHTNFRNNDFPPTHCRVSRKAQIFSECGYSTFVFFFLSYPKVYTEQKLAEIIYMANFK